MEREDRLYRYIWKKAIDGNIEYKRFIRNRDKVYTSIRSVYIGNTLKEVGYDSDNKVAYKIDKEGSVTREKWRQFKLKT